MISSALIFSSVLAVARAQQVGTNTAEVHPPLTVSTCTSSGCTTSQQSIVLDANWRWLHTTTGYTNCYTGNQWNATLCPDATTCAANCALDGADYVNTYGIKASGNELDLTLVTGSGSTANSGSRTYLMAPGSTTEYQLLKLLNQEFTFDVDVSALPCGLNGALYLSEMDADGGMSKYPTNKAGAKYGTGYCDAQCPRDIKFIDGQANNVGWNATSANAGNGDYGSCCNEMDIWEANSISTAYTPHPCSDAGLTRCSGTGCTTECDQAGCDFNSYRMGDKTFYGPGMTIDTNKKFTVVTQFITDDGTSSGTLSEIRRYYVQNGVVYANSQSEIAGVTGNSITDSFCSAQKTAFGDTNTFKAKGGLANMSAALAKGMVLVMSIWDDHTAQMLWLDAPYPVGASTSSPGVVRGTCSPTSGDPTTIESTEGSSTVKFSNIKWGALNSTFSGTTGSVGGGGSKPSSSSVAPGAPSSTSKATSPTSTAGSGAGSVPKYGQCGGVGWQGATQCAAGSTCTASNQYYSQCL